SAKNYEALDSINSLDFVFMFVPIESAYTLALQADQSLFQAAYDRGVVIVSPTTLMATLRTVANIWRYEKQNRYAQQIADEGGKLYDQFVLLVESLDDVGKKIEATQSSYELARKRLSEGRGNLVGRVENLKKLGAKSKKNLPDSVKGLLED
ncbi:MAG: DNA recombination protein RmuC, partial [Pseudomonadales bacterium]